MTPHGGLQDFHQLMRHRIMDILLVASPYDSFILEEAGQIGERVVGEFRNLDLHYGPGLTTVQQPTPQMAISACEALLDRIDRRQQDRGTSVEFAVQMLERDSTAPPRRG